MNKIKKRLALTFALMMTFSYAACGDGNEQGGTDNGGKKNEIIVTGDIESNADVWIASASQKIMATESKESKYAEYVQSSIDIHAVKNEYENGQIVISAKKDLTYSITLSDLKHTSDSEAKIGKENFCVYMQKYIYVARNYNQNGEPTGDYPDAIIPQENAIECGENIVRAGKNGAAWLEYYIPKTAKAGVYTGTATVHIGNDSMELPVSVKVYDYTLSDETTSKSVFILQPDVIEEYELDSTQEMVDKYNELLIRSRVASGTLALDSSVDAYIEKAVELVKEKGMASISMKGGHEVEYKNMNTFNQAAVIDFVCKLAKRSLEENINFVEKIVMYNNWIDEPFFIPRQDGIVPYQINRFNETMELIKEQLFVDPDFAGEFGQELIASVDKIPHVITDYYEQDKHRVSGPLKNEDGSYFSYEGLDVALCPKFDGIGSEEERAQYDQFEERWIYCCNNPMNPYPTYHIDASLTSSISVGWMMAEYDIVGNLYWSVNTHKDAAGNWLADPYDEAHRGVGANGDGWLLYPGKPYGVDGPVSSIRLEAVRDGNEDYELIRDLQELYAANGENASDIIRLLSQSIYKDSSVTGDSNDFEQARITLLSMLEAAGSETGFTIGCIEKIVDPFEGERYKLSVKVSEGTELYNNGELLTSNNDGVYDLEIHLTEEKNYLSLKAVKGMTVSEFELYLGGKITKVESSGYASSMFTGAVTSSGLNGDWFTVGLTNVDDQKISFAHEAWAQIGANTKNVRIYVYNPSDTEKEFTVAIEYANVKQKVLTGTLKAGANAIDLELFSSVNWQSRKYVKSIEFILSDMTKIGFGNVYIFSK